jgi:CRISPR-associated protein Csx16
MTTWFISRHPGALNWMQRSGIGFDRHVAHIDLQQIDAGDKVIGSLPVNLAAEVCARGAEYWHLSLQLTPGDRGRELSAEELTRFGAVLERFEIGRTS